MGFCIFVGENVPQRTKKQVFVGLQLDLMLNLNTKLWLKTQFKVVLKLENPSRGNDSNCLKYDNKEATQISHGDKM